MIRQVDLQLSELISNVNDISQAKIDNITDEISDIMSHAANTLGMVHPQVSKATKYKMSKKPDDKAWMTDESRKNRAVYRRLKRWDKASGGCNEIKKAKNLAFKTYKKTLSKNFKSYVSDMQKKIRKLKSTDTKSYWRLINGDRQRKQEVVNGISRDVFAKHFESLCNVPEENLIGENIADEEVLLNAALDETIREEEVLKCIVKLKNNKACGYDGIINEFLKYSCPKLLATITNLFNVILACGKLPKAWAIGYISPIYKGKGATEDPDNYRGITIVSCFGKLFTSVLNQRISLFLENNNMLGVEQAGFRKGQSTIDHIFTLHCLIDVYLRKKKKLYCAFVDYRKAFDSIQHALLWDKLLKMNVGGKVLNIIQDMYKKTKLCVKHMRTYSHFFSSNIGLLQGENLSPVLFSMFLNDLKGFLGDYDVKTPTLLQTAQLAQTEQIDDFMFLFLLLYADDTAILAENPGDLQNALNGLDKYCKEWGLNVNVNKTKVVVFSRGKIRNIPVFNLNGNNVEVVFSYTYLGVLFNYNNKFNEAQKNLCLSGNRAMFSLLKRCRKLHLPIDIQLDLFEKCVQPILLYGCEVWGSQSIDLVSRAQLRFLKLALGVHKTTPSCMIFGDLGCYPIRTEINSRLLTYWYKLMIDKNNNVNKLSCTMLRLHMNLYNNGDYKLPWLEHVHSTLNNLGLTFYWHRQLVSVQVFKNMVKQRIRDQYLQTWNGEIYNNNLCYNYRMFKTKFCFERYLVILDGALRRNILKFRFSNHKLPIHSQRFLNIPRDERVCELCETGELGDEFHYLFNCKDERIMRERVNALTPYFHNKPNAFKYHALINCKSKVKLKKLARFVGVILSLFR